MKAIETHYAGHRFRSRLEARWAVFFDALSIAWRYELEGFHLPDGSTYLPDFWLPQLRDWVEVKGATPDTAGLRKAAAFSGQFHRRDQRVKVLVGEVPRPEPVLADRLNHLMLWQSESDQLPEVARAGYGAPEPLAAPEDPSEYAPGWVWWPMSTGRARRETWFECPVGHVFTRFAGWRCLRCEREATATERILDAYRTARSARFEHGETPQPPTERK